MSSLDFAFIFLLGVLGAIFVVYLLSLLLLPLIRFVRIIGSSSQIRNASLRLKSVDRLIADRKCFDALKLLRKSMLTQVAGSPPVIEALREHHQNVLSRCLIIAEELHSRPDNIAEVERLLLERAELQVLLIKASESYRALKYRREKSGKSFPSWSKSEFENRMLQIQGELKRNTSALEKALDYLFAALASSSKDSIVYH